MLYTNGVDNKILTSNNNILTGLANINREEKYCSITHLSTTSDRISLCGTGCGTWADREVFILRKHTDLKVKVLRVKGELFIMLIIKTGVIFILFHQTQNKSMQSYFWKLQENIKETLLLITVLPNMIGSRDSVKLDKMIDII